MIKGIGAVTWLEERALPARLVRRDGLCITTARWPADHGIAQRPSPVHR
jgi:hypothetical protein